MNDHLGRPIAAGDSVAFARLSLTRQSGQIDVGTVKFIDDNYINISSPDLPSAWRFPGEVIVLTGTDIDPTQITTTGEQSLG